MADMNAGKWEIWWMGRPGESEFAVPNEMPYGTKLLGVEVDNLAGLEKFKLPEGAGWYLKMDSSEAIGEDVVPAKVPLVLAVTTVDQLDSWFKDGNCPNHAVLELHLTQATGEWLLANRDLVEREIDRIRIHQPTHEHMKEAVENDYRDPRLFFEALQLPVRTTGLPACMVPGTRWMEPPRLLKSSMFDSETGRVKIRNLASYHVAEHYRSKSVRCRDCVVNDRCDGQHINMIRDQGLRLLRPLKDTDWAVDAAAQLKEIWPTPQERIATGMKHQLAPSSLEGYEQPSEVVEDPLAVIERKRAERKERMKARAARSAAAAKKRREDGESGVPSANA